MAVTLAEIETSRATFQTAYDLDPKSADTITKAYALAALTDQYSEELMDLDYAV